MEMFFEGSGKSSITIIPRIDNKTGTAKTRFQLLSFNTPGQTVILGESKDDFQNEDAFLISTDQLNSGSGGTCNLRLQFFPISEDGSDINLFLKAVQNGTALVAKDPHGTVLTQDDSGADLGTVELKKTKTVFFFIALS